MKIGLFDTTGTKIKDITLTKTAFGSGVVNPSLLRQALYIYEYNRHQHTSRTKTRGEVVGSGRKIWRQKGTGRARHGDRYAPLFVGGGRAHGPNGILPQPPRLPKKMKRQALASALILKLQEKALAILNDLDNFQPRTKQAVDLLRQIANHPQSKVLIITDKRYPNFYLAARNLQQVTFKRSSLVNAYDIISHHYLLITQSALKDLQARTKQ